MSRREDRSSEPKRRDPRLNREPSRKRSRRDGKPETERLNAERELDKDRVERDHKHRHGLQDPLPHEAPLSHDSKVESEMTKKETSNRTDRYQGVSKHSSDPSEVPQSGSYIKHNDRGSWQNARSFSRWTETECGPWRDPKEQQNDRGMNKTVSSDMRQKDQKTKDNREDNHVRRHDGYFETEANLKPPRKRHSFREQKLPVHPEETNRAAADLMTPNPQNNAADNGRRDERRHSHRHSDKPEGPFAGASRGNFSSRVRSSASGRSRGRDRIAPRQGYRPSGGRVEKWEHDLCDKANKSPTPDNEEERIKKIEALLSS